MKKVYLTWLLPLMTLSAHAVNFNGSYENDANTMFIEGKKLSITEGNACEHEGILTATKNPNILAYRNKHDDGVVSGCLESQKTYKIQAITIDPKTKHVTKLKIIDGKYMNGIYTKIKPEDAK